MLRYDSAQRALHSESAALQGEAGAMAASLAPQRDPERGLVSDLLFYLVAEGDAGHCAKSFDRLAAWVDTSLDMYRVRCAWRLLGGSWCIRAATQCDGGHVPGALCRGGFVLPCS